MFNFDTNKNIEVYTILTSAHEINEVILKDIGYIIYLYSADKTNICYVSYERVR